MGPLGSSFRREQFSESVSDFFLQNFHLCLGSGDYMDSVRAPASYFEKIQKTGLFRGDSSYPLPFNRKSDGEKRRRAAAAFRDRRIFSFDTPSGRIFVPVGACDRFFLRSALPFAHE